MKKFCKSLLSVSVFMLWLNATAYDFTADGLYYNILSDTECEVTYKEKISEEKYSSPYDGEVIIPATVENAGKILKVVKVGHDAFNGCSELSSLTVGSGVNKIGDGAFNGCTSLKNLKIEDGTDFSRLEFGISKPDYESSTPYYFGQFQDCPLEYVYIGRDLLYRRVEKYGFIYCGPFEDQTYLKKVTFGKMVSEIGSHAFVGCTSLAEINVINTNPPAFVSGNFDMDERYFEDSHFHNVILNVMPGSLTVYRQAKIWKNFLKTKESGVEAVESDEVKVFANGGSIMVLGADETDLVEIFNLNGQLICRGFGNEFEVGNSGIYIVRIAGKTYKVVVM